MERLKNRETEIRNQYVKEIKRVLLGPGTEDISADSEYEVISENPKARYITGILYSINDKSKNKMNTFNELVITDENLEEVSESDGENKEDNFVVDNNYFPSTMGLTFYCETAENFKIDYKIETATYNKTKNPFISLTEVQVRQIKDYIQLSEENERNIFTILDIDYENKTVRYKDDNEDNKKVLQGLIDNLNVDSYSELESLFYRLKKSNYYERKPFIYEGDIYFDYGVEKYDTKTIEIDEDNKFELFFKVFPMKISSNKIIHTITLVIKNVSSADPMFQTKITLDNNETFKFSASEDIKIPNLESLTDEEARSIFLYRNKKTYGVGHGISVVWKEKENRLRKLETDYIPEYETIPMSFAIDNLDEDILNPESYLINVGKNQQIEKLEVFVEEYEKWIDNLEQRAASLNQIYKKYTEENISKCREAWLRMKKAVVFLKENDDAFTCFNYANEAILLQRYSNNQDKTKSFKNKDYSDLNGSFKWRPFQLAFILHSLESVLNEDSEERDLLDLMYVTTGGGKTEAYLFLIAVIILYRRMKQEGSAGVSVIMRYTLRLLTAQQFERATQLICVLEYIRKVESSTFGETEISIGLWIGEGTENRIVNAKDVLADMADSYNLTQALEKNRFQVLKCPWCNEEHSIIPANDKKSFTSKRNWGYCAIDSRSNNYNMKCMNKECVFAKGLPIYVVDESIYKVRPTLIFGTVDKFAQLPIKEEAQRLFGSDSDNIRRPELIIQDELHLISGPLGSIVGLYEASFDYILQDSVNGSKPKYIASTATIKNSEQQVKGLFDRKVTQFPPDGLEVEDNFFIKEEKTKSGRKYLGIMPTGKSLVTTEVRLTAIMIQALNHMEYMNLTDEEMDTYWTTTGYFNSIRELGKVSGLLMDDTKEYTWQIANRNNTNRRKFYNSEELTSRISGSEIPEILRKLDLKYNSDLEYQEAIDTLVATNMISVGIDIARLNSMFVVGQPKLTSEYIQATSRVGRQKLGAVFTLYNSTRSRDRSHYETFYSYHQNMYKYVESSSVTPFSLPALDKALPAVMTNMVRNTNEILSGDTTPNNIIGNEKLIEQIKEYLLLRLRETEKDGLNYKRDAINKIDNFIDAWLNLANLSINEEKKMEYHKHNMSSGKFEGLLLLKNFGDKNHSGAMEVMNSMRDVEETSSLKIIRGDD